MTIRRRRTASGRPAAPPGLDPNRFPGLVAFFRGYLHEDFPEEHGSADGAAAAFCRDASPAERQSLAREIDALTEVTGDWPAAALRALVTGALGSRWRPASVKEVRALLRALRGGGA